MTRFLHVCLRLGMLATLGWGFPGLAMAQTASAASLAASASNHWAFQPLHVPALPRVQNRRWARTDVDRFILARLEAEGRTPRFEADKRVWLRRSTFTLTGLPPTPAEMDAFLADSSDRAMARVVERLLASPHYGERWGRHWLDLVRYADCAGDSSDYPIPEARKYRDYVIASFNRDNPYDRFLREQIAGDLLPSKNAEEWREQTIATGFIALARRFNVGNAISAHLTIEDTIETLGRSVLGLSLGCARCHDHKYDPISMADYYGLYGIFASTRYPHAGSEERKYQTNFVLLIPVAQAEALRRPYAEEMARLEGEAARLEKEIDAQPGDGAAEKKLKQRYEKLWEKMDALAAQPPAIDSAYAVADDVPSNARVQRRGDPANLGEEVPRGFLQILGGQRVSATCPGSGRLELAGWLTQAAAPLAARVMVNRIWQHHFGRGLVETPSDFGFRGQPPRDAALLDFMAALFIESGWSVKAMHRLLLDSAVSAQAAAAAPGDSATWGPVRRRLDAEEIRDALLAVSGELDLDLGGPHPFPPASQWDFSQHKPFTAVYETAKRSVYLMQQRIRKHPFLATFDGADANASTAERVVTTTPLQALFVMNDSLAHAVAGKFAARLQRDQATDGARIDWAHQLAFGRPARAEEIQEGLHYLACARATLDRADGSGSADGMAAWSSYARALLASNEFFFVE